MSAVTEILAMRSELEGRFEMLDLAIERIEAERRENRIRLETLEACLNLVSREVAGPEGFTLEEISTLGRRSVADAENVTRVTPPSGRPAYRVEEAGGTVTTSRPATRASKRAPRRPVRQLVLEAIRKTKTDGTTVNALYLTLPSYRRRLIDSAVAHWIGKGNVVEAVGWLYCHGFEPEVVKALAAQVGVTPSPAPAIQGGDPPNPPGTSSPVTGTPQQLGLESLPHSLPHAGLDKIEAAAPPMRQRLIDFMAARGGSALMQEIVAAGIDAGEVYRAEREGRIEGTDPRGTYALVLEGEEAQAAQ